MKKIYAILFILFFSTVGFITQTQAQTTVKKVVLQAFWWDYWNSNHPGSWANYLTELAPRLKEMGIDAIWIPPIAKGSNGVNSVGYDVFDHYDLGDKFQKGTLNTRIGTKDELLRMIAVMHANGIEVIQDVVLNHLIGAGDLNGTLGSDPAAPDDKFKNFRYSSFALPAVYGVSDNYLSRSGRWPKNYQNFHPNTDHNCNSGDICQQSFGPDICFYSGAIGTSSNAIYNPAQGADYMRNQARSWVVWLKKQTAVDGFRWDATKHFEVWVQQDLSYNLKYNAGWANGGEGMFNVGEYVDFNAGNLDTYVNNVKTANGGSDFLMGSFDFSLREAFKNMIDGNGFYNMSLLVGAQQSQRVAYYATPNLYVHRTVPFVNNHDTFRPMLDANGNYVGWNSGSELAPHIDPFNDRMPLAYAMALAVDGAPQIFFEDLFNIGGTGKRYSHDPNNTTDLPVRTALEKIIKLHQQLNFKAGAYKIRSTVAGGNAYFPPGSSDQDLLIIERSNKAIIAINDNGANLQEAWVDTDFPAGTILVDHAGFVAGTSLVYNDKRALISAPAVNPTNGTYGFAIWGPQGTLPIYAPTRITSTTQEWEFSDDLGDNHCESSKQGGRIPDNSTDWRYAGKIFVESGKTISFDLYADGAKNLTLEFVDINGSVLHTAAGTGNLASNFVPATTGWVNMRVRNTTGVQLGQTCYLKVTYTAPANIADVTLYPADVPASTWTGAFSNNWMDCANWLNGNLPGKTTSVSISAGAQNFPEIASDIEVKNINIAPKATLLITSGGSLNVTDLVLEADATGYAQFKNLGTTNIAGNFTQQQSIANLGWHLLSSPIANPATVGEFGTIAADAVGGTANTINLLYWDAATSMWTNISSATTPLVNGQGYNAFVGAHGILEVAGNVDVTGSPNSSVTPQLYYHNGIGSNAPGFVSTIEGWNLLGNPLSATLDFSTLSLTNVNNAFYIWDASAGAYKSWSVGGISNPYIAPMQGFWVQANNGGAPSIGTLTFANTTITEEPIFYKTIADHVVLSAYPVLNNVLKDDLVIGFNAGTTDGFDPDWDAKKLRNSEGTPNLYCDFGGDFTSINTIDYGVDRAEAKLLDVTFSSPKQELFTIELDPTFLTNSYTIYLRDKKANLLIDLAAKKHYTFLNDPAFENRFKLIIGSQKVDQSNVLAESVSAFGKDGALHIYSNLTETSNFALLDLSGRVMLRGTFTEGLTRVETAFAKGIYVLQIDSKTMVQRIKVIL